MQKLDTITAGISSIVFHFTKLVNAVSILEGNKFILSTLMVNDDEEKHKPGKKKDKDKYFYLSVARSKNSKFISTNYRSGVVFTLDGTKLGNKYSAKPVYYYNHRESTQDWSEQEDRIFSKYNMIPNALSYVKEIAYTDGSPTNVGDFSQISLITAKNLKILIDIAEKHNIPIYLYEKSKDLVTNNKKKATPVETVKEIINNIIKGDHSTPDSKSREKNPRKLKAIEGTVECYEFLKRLEANPNLNMAEELKGKYYDEKGNSSALKFVLDNLKYGAQNLKNEITNDFSLCRGQPNEYSTALLDKTTRIMRKERCSTILEFAEFLSKLKEKVEENSRVSRIKNKAEKDLEKLKKESGLDFRFELEDPTKIGEYQETNAIFSGFKISNKADLFKLHTYGQDVISKLKAVSNLMGCKFLILKEEFNYKTDLKEEVENFYSQNFDWYDRISARAILL